MKIFKQHVNFFAGIQFNLAAGGGRLTLPEPGLRRPGYSHGRLFAKTTRASLRAGFAMCRP